MLCCVENGSRFQMARFTNVGAVVSCSQLVPLCQNWTFSAHSRQSSINRDAWKLGFSKIQQRIYYHQMGELSRREKPTTRLTSAWTCNTDLPPQFSLHISKAIVTWLKWAFTSKRMTDRDRVREGEINIQPERGKSHVISLHRVAETVSNLT